MRVALIGFIVAAFAFAAGAVLRLSNSESGAVVPKVARSLDGEPRSGALRLRPVDPGALRLRPVDRAALPRPPDAAAAAPPVQTPVGPPPLAPPPPTDGRGSFDSSGPGVVPEANSFDSEG